MDAAKEMAVMDRSVDDVGRGHLATNGGTARQWSLVQVPPRDAAVSRSKAGLLPGFTTFNSFLAGIASRKRMELEREEQKRRIEERKRQEYREERERRTAIFTMPGYPPLAMAPDIDPEYLENLIPSDKQFERLFPGNPRLICAAKDAFGENEAFVHYTDWLSEMIVGEAPAARVPFYKTLLKEARLDHEESFEEITTLLRSAPRLGRFEVIHLDRDLKTTKLEARLEKGDIHIYLEHDPDVQAVYGELFSRYPYLERFEKYYKLDEGTERLEAENDNWPEWWENQPDVVKEKYGHVRRVIKDDAPPDWDWGELF